MTVRFVTGELDQLRQLQFTIPLTPIAKARGTPGFAGGGRIEVFPNSKTRRFEDDVRRFALHALDGRPMFSGPVAFAMVARFRPPDSVSQRIRQLMIDGQIAHTSTPDLDNVEKAVIDGLKQRPRRNKDPLPGVLLDDRLITRIHTTKIWADNDGLDIRLTPFKVQVLGARRDAKMVG
jgi:Holliday junction resolvase RusA-like endonuclease